MTRLSKLFKRSSQYQQLDDNNVVDQDHSYNLEGGDESFSTYDNMSGNSSLSSLGDYGVMVSRYHDRARPLELVNEERTMSTRKIRPICSSTGKTRSSNPRR